MTRLKAGVRANLMRKDRGKGRRMLEIRVTMEHGRRLRDTCQEYFKKTGVIPEHLL